MIKRYAAFWVQGIVAIVFSLAPAYAHDQFLLNSEFGGWVRHCHQDLLFRKEECWKIYQNYTAPEIGRGTKSGIVLLVPDDRDPFFFELRLVRLPYHTLSLSVDDRPSSLRFSCDFLNCGPLERDGEEKLMSQMDSGDMLYVRSKNPISGVEVLLFSIPLADLK